VIMDEIHHAGDGLSWGEAVREAFSGAVRRLTLTGTPFRTSSTERIPFVTYEEDSEGLRSVADYSYGYREALASNVVRPVLFAAYSGVARWSTNAGEMAASLTDELTQEQEFQAWKTILDPKGEWVPHVLGAAAQRLEEIRASGMPDAGMLVLASDQETAKAYARVLKTVTGETPTIALSEDPKASSKITAFTNGTDKYLVAVRMVSEGVDIPRTAVLVWLTSYRTPLFFAQAVGRVVRSRQPGESATVFLPAVRPLLALAAELEVSRDHVLYAKAAPADDDEGMIDVEVPDRVEGENAGEYVALGSEAQFAHVLFSGKAVTSEGTPAATSEMVEGAEAELGMLAGLLSPQETAAMLARHDIDLRARGVAAAQAYTSAPVAAPEPPSEALHEQMTAVRREISSLVNRVSSRTGKQHSEVHIMARRAVPGPSNADASLDILTRRRDWLLTRSH
jgi:superfamily II DNA or RNA helicase